VLFSFLTDQTTDRNPSFLPLCFPLCRPSLAYTVLNLVMWSSKIGLSGRVKTPQTWSWVHFSWLNPTHLSVNQTKPSDIRTIMTQRNPNHFSRVRPVAPVYPTTLCRELCKNGWTDRFTPWVVDSGGPKEAQVQSYSSGGANACAHMGGHIGAIWRIRLNRPCAAAMRSYVKLLWPLVIIAIVTIIIIIIHIITNAATTVSSECCGWFGVRSSTPVSMWRLFYTASIGCQFGGSCHF